MSYVWERNVSFDFGYEIRIGRNREINTRLQNICVNKIKKASVIICVVYLIQLRCCLAFCYVHLRVCLENCSNKTTED